MTPNQQAGGGHRVEFRSFSDNHSFTGDHGHQVGIIEILRWMFLCRPYLMRLVLLGYSWSEDLSIVMIHYPDDLSIVNLRFSGGGYKKRNSGKQNLPGHIARALPGDTTPCNGANKGLLLLAIDIGCLFGGVYRVHHTRTE